MGRLELSLLGAFHARLDGININDLKTVKTRALLAYLALTAGRHHSREALAEMLWPGQPEGQARHSLNQALYTLRKALNSHPNHKPFLLSTSQSIGFNLECDHFVDVLEFKCLLETCRTHPHARRETCQECLERLQSAVDLYQGDLLLEISPTGCLEFAEWAALEREHLQRLASQLLGELSLAYELRGEYERALPLAERRAALDPLWEPAHRQLMRLLVTLDRQSEALACYQRLRASLQDELRVEPDPETRALYEAIRSSPEHASFINLPRLRQLPAHLTPFIGREAELASLCAYLLDPACRLLSVLGSGGSGKTRLALEAARRSRMHFPHGMYLVQLSSLHSHESFLPALAETLGLNLREGVDPLSQIAVFLRTKTALLILDSFETVTEAAPLVAELLRASPATKVLVATRARLGLKAEQVFHLEGMRYPTPDQVVDQRDFSAVALFLSAARRVNPSFQPSDTDLSQIARICQLVEGMPLGVLLASAWADQLSPAEIAHEIEKSLDFLSVEWGDIPPRQRSLRATFDYSWDLLSQQEKDALAGISVFRGGFTHQAATQVTGAGFSVLRALSAKSLLQILPDGHYLMHDLVRQFAEEKLAERPVLEADIRERHCVTYLEMVRDWEIDLVSAFQTETLREIDPLIEDLRAACRWAIAQRNFQPLEAALEAVCLYHSLRMRLEGGVGLCRELLENPGEEAFTGENRRLLAHILTWLAHFERLAGEMTIARQNLEKALSVLDTLHEQEVDVRLIYAQWLYEYGGMEDSLLSRCEAYNRSAALYRELDQTWRLTGVLYWLGEVYARLGDKPRAQEAHFEGIELCRTIGESRRLAGMLNSLAYDYVMHGEFVNALNASQEAAECFFALGDPYTEAIGSLHLGTIYLWNGRNQEASQLLEQYLPVFKEFSDAYYYAFGCIGMAVARLNLGDYPGGKHYLQTALNSAQEHDYRRESAASYALLSVLTLREGDAQRGLDLASQAVEQYRQMGYRGELGGALGCLALIYFHLEEIQAAQPVILEGFEIIIDTHALFTLLWVLPPAVLLLIESGHPQKALETYTALTHIPTWRDSRWLDDLLGEYIRLLRGCLSPADQEKALQRGQSIDPFDLATELLEFFP